MTKQPRRKQTVRTRHKQSSPQGSGERSFETDSQYLLKLAAVAISGTIWLKFKLPIVWLGVQFAGIPLGFILGLILIRKFELHQSDRKIWYAVLVIVTIICAFSPAAIYI